MMIETIFGRFIKGLLDIRPVFGGNSFGSAEETDQSVSYRQLTVVVRLFSETAAAGFLGRRSSGHSSPDVFEVFRIDSMLSEGVMLDKGEMGSASMRTVRRANPLPQPQAGLGE